MDCVSYLHFANTQREEASSESLNKIKKLGIDYSPLKSKNIPINHLNKILDFIYFPKLIKRICKQNHINLIIARGTPAGALAYLATRANKLPFVVESFEPHADYMKIAGEWKAYGLRYLFQKNWEEKQKKNAKYLITVASNYKNKLIQEGINKNKILIAPCSVDQNQFFPDLNIRKRIRSELNISENAVVGVYAGKFGGLYLSDKAFSIFKKAFLHFEDFHLLLLTKTDSGWLNEKINQFHLPLDRIHHEYVPYAKVNNYLNIADLAFALYKSHKYSKYLSPVKIGEYWACGLPVYITPNLGDETNWISKRELGDIIDLNNNELFNNLSYFSSEKIIKTGSGIRDPLKIKIVYDQILKQIQ